MQHIIEQRWGGETKTPNRRRFVALAHGLQRGVAPLVAIRTLLTRRLMIPWLFSQQRKLAVAGLTQQALKFAGDEEGRLSIDSVLLTPPATEPERAIQISHPLHDLPTDVWLPADCAVQTPQADRYEIRGRTVYDPTARPLADWRGAVKRVEDLLLGVPLLFLSLPVLAMAAIAIRLESPGPALLQQWRFGCGHKPFAMLKLRSMRYESSNISGIRPTVKNDPRVTRVGRFLRSTSIDELPQLINVLRGEMSLVGPRAHPVDMQIDGVKYEDAVPFYRARHRVNPGMTGLAQVNGCRGLVNSIEMAQRRLDYDLQYVETWSLALDLRILWMTTFKIFVDGGV
jgi:lipopolysaccharide/colanic/teichoic acid biosynthesis glycosyltransferase